MVNQKIIEYLNKYKKEYEISIMKENLIKQGFNVTEVNDAVNFVNSSQTKDNENQVPLSTTKDKSKLDDFFVLDDQTKETMKVSAIALLITQLVIFFGDFLVGLDTISVLIYVLVGSVIGGAVSGLLISKLYYHIMDFISTDLKFLLPFTNTFFKLLFFPVVIGAIVSLVFSLIFAGGITLVGASLGGAAGGIIGGALGGSIVLLTIWSIIITIIGRFIYAKILVKKVGKYYKDYK